MSIQIEKVCSDNFSMEFFRFGKGDRPFVILPGLSVQSVMGAAAAVANGYKLFEEDFTVYVFDRRSDLPSSYSVFEMARDTAEAFRILGLQDINIFGASQGGMMAMTIAAEHPELVSKLVLGSTAAHIHKKQYQIIEEWISLAKEKDSVGLYLKFGEAIYPAKIFEQYREALISAGKTVADTDLKRFITLAKGTKGFNIENELEKIQCPVLAIGSEDDAVLGKAATMEIVDKLNNRPDYQLYMYKNYGHAAYDTAPDYKQRIFEFLMQ